ncbi:MAG: heavy metal transport/detoxification protein [Mesoaciditoga sp.]|uniref:heavy-metal-associated domain-containing protein n=1 Tax=Athalassotoga sp. TaxID=2022597 RepID=UPI000CC793C5|nr:MAG: heavy metal transport/detoxification protein [Mesoaciditoga sp.]PMP80868.1 MAG: heavy metal transport/detoxification protein [Mesoaciditoga sp.]HEU23986.1 heavy-metal-associated domain-containing protein [Mesoaciditoga lauensis]
MRLYVEGMTCEHCKMHVEEALKGIKGVKRAEVDLNKGTAEVETKREISFDTFKKAIEEAGYTLVKIE